MRLNPHGISLFKAFASRFFALQFPWSEKMQLEFKVWNTGTEEGEKENCKVKLPNINFMMNMTKEFLDGKMDGVSYSLDFPYELQKGIRKCIWKTMTTVI